MSIVWVNIFSSTQPGPWIPAGPGGALASSGYGMPTAGGSPYPSQPPAGTLIFVIIILNVCTYACTVSTVGL